jgi:uncharacterized protein (TIGR00255 family)
MIESMTGFGRADVHMNGYSVEVEIRTVNNRYCDIFIKMPSDVQHFETEVRTLIQNRFERGKINVTIKVENTGSNGNGVRINAKLAQEYFAMLNSLADELNLPDQPTLENLIQFQDIFQSGSISDEQENAFRKTLMVALNQAIEKTVEMRQKEGVELANDSLERLATIRTIIDEIKLMAGERIIEARTKIQDRVQAILNDEHYDKDRLELEIALLADKMDITEELVRLDAHIKFFTEAINGKQSAGRKLNFLMQEMLREVNTIGSKAYHAEIAHKVVDIKENIEIIREQIQNFV